MEPLDVPVLPSPPPLAAVWPDALAFWAAYLWTMAPEVRLLRRSRELSAADDPHSLRVLRVAAEGAVAAATLVSLFVPAASIARGPAAARACVWIGTALVVAGAAIRRRCMRALGEYFTARVVAQPGQRVIDHGPYRRVRHPSYAAAMLVYLGLGVALGNWLSVVVATVGVAGAYGYRVRVEERVLAERLGEPYRAYMARTKRFVPGVY